MSGRLMRQVWDVQIPPRQKLVLLALAFKADEHGTCALPLPHLATMVRCSLRTLQQRLVALEAAGVLSHTGEGDTRLWRLHLGGVQGRGEAVREGEA